MFEVITISDECWREMSAEQLTRLILLQAWFFTPEASWAEKMTYDALFHRG